MPAKHQIMYNNILKTAQKIKITSYHIFTMILQPLLYGLNYRIKHFKIKMDVKGVYNTITSTGYKLRETQILLSVLAN